MKKFIYLLFTASLYLSSACAQANNAPAFAPEPLALTIPEVTVARDFGKEPPTTPPSLFCYMGIGKFYKTDYPVLSPDDSAKTLSSPFVTLQKLLYIYNVTQQYDDIPTLSDPRRIKETQAYFKAMMEKYKERYIQSVSKTKNITVLCYVLVPPDKCFMYIKTGSFPYLPEWFILVDGQWYTDPSPTQAQTEAHRISIKDQLGMFYMKYRNNDAPEMEITSPPTSAQLEALAKDVALVKLYDTLAKSEGLKPFDSYLKAKK